MTSFQLVLGHFHTGLRLRTIMRHFLNSLVLCFTLCGCVFPFPHRQIVVPKINAKITEAGKVVTNSEFIFAKSNSPGANCEIFLASAKTDSGGRAIINLQSEFKLGLMILGYPVANWELCLKRDSEIFSLWKSEYIGDLPRKLTVNCDLASSQMTFNGLNLVGYGLCKFSKAE